jgi:ketosteroid isomerase-like protein
MTNKSEVERLLHGYCDSVDRVDMDLFASLFTDNAVLDYGFGRIFTGRDAIVALLSSRLANYKATSHHLSNIAVEEISLSEFHTTSTIYAWHRLLDDTQAEVWGRYEDVIVHEPDGWRIAKHVVRAAGSRGFATPDGLPSPFEPFNRK